MTATDPAATLQALADHYRSQFTAADSEMIRWAEHIESVNVGHQLGPDNYVCSTCGERYPCTDVRTLLAVASAAGIQP